MSTKHRSTPLVALLSMAAVSGFAASGALAAVPGYVTADDGGYIHTGSGGCLITSEWSAQKPAPECHPALAQNEEPIRSEVAALEEAAPAVPPPEKVLAAIRLDATTLFNFDAANLSPAGRTALDELIAKVGALHDVSSIVVEGHTDRIGSEAYNEALSRRRAQAVGTYLSANATLTGTAIRTEALGESNPVATCEGVHGNAALIECLRPNRRVEVKIMGMEERPAQ